MTDGWGTVVDYGGRHEHAPSDRLDHDRRHCSALEHPPVAITFHETAPNGATRYFDEPMSEPTPDGRAGRVAAPCVFWIHGHETTFSTLPQDHGNCSVGLFTHGLADAADIVDKADVADLLDVGWVTMEAFADVAALARRPAAISYGPLDGGRGHARCRPSPGHPPPDDGDSRRHPGRVLGQTPVPDPAASRRPQGCGSFDGLRPVKGPYRDGRWRTHLRGSRREDRRIGCALGSVVRADRAVAGYAER